MAKQRFQFSRREMLRLSAMAGAATLVGARSSWAQCVDSSPIEIHRVEFTGCSVGAEAMPLSPFILDPYTDPLPVPKALRPGWRAPDGTLLPADHPDAWTVRTSAFGSGVVVRPGPQPGHQDALGEREANHGSLYGLPPAGTHQLWTSGTGVMGQNLNLPDPILYHIRLQVGGKRFTSSRVAHISKDAVTGALSFGDPPPGAPAIPAGTVNLSEVDALPNMTINAYRTPDSTIYGFNGSFPGPLINADYGRPALVRFENDLDINPDCRDRQDFGAPDWAFLTHLHNGHTSPESDGQPHHLLDHEGGYQPGEWMDNLYLGYPAGNDDREKQSFLWFHDHRMHHTGPNVYKGMVGLMPHYDPFSVSGGPGLDPGDERLGLRLPGVRTNNGDGTFDVEYDIPMAFYDCALDDGVTEHRDQHTPLYAGQFPEIPANQVCGATHPEWWGQLYHRHHVNHGFVGDVFTVNCTAFPVLHVKRRKYRLRFLGASLSRQYRLSIRTGTPMAFPGQQGQWNFGVMAKGKGAKATKATDKGTICMKMCQIASEGGLLPFRIEQQEIEIWPAKRREVIVDFSRYIDGTPTSNGDVMYLTNTLQMLNGRKETDNQEPGFDAKYAVPMVKIVIDGDAPDNSLEPVNNQLLRAAPDFVPFDRNRFLPPRIFELQRGGTMGGETEWLINGLGFDPLFPLALPRFGSAEHWGIDNGGGGWTHPMHIHQEEHHVVWRSTNLAKHADDTGKEDVVALEGSEQTVIYRRFRTFLGNYVAHCHQLAHEDHNMMFGWTIVP